MVLHTLNASPSSRAFAECLRLLVPGDSLLLLGDGVYAALAGTPSRAQLEASGADLKVLYPDAAAAGILAQLGDVQTVDMAGFVALSERCPRQLAWY
jgi:tRNA 2-thiouridine synthesizing protein B